MIEDSKGPITGLQGSDLYDTTLEFIENKIGERYGTLHCDANNIFTIAIDKKEKVANLKGGVLKDKVTDTFSSKIGTLELVNIPYTIGSLDIASAYIVRYVYERASQAANYPSRYELEGFKDTALSLGVIDETLHEKIARLNLSDEFFKENLKNLDDSEMGEMYEEMCFILRVSDSLLDLDCEEDLREVKSNGELVAGLCSYMNLKNGKEIVEAIIYTHYPYECYNDNDILEVIDLLKQRCENISLFTSYDIEKNKKRKSKESLEKEKEMRNNIIDRGIEVYTEVIADAGSDKMEHDRFIIFTTRGNFKNDSNLSKVAQLKTCFRLSTEVGQFFRRDCEATLYRQGGALKESDEMCEIIYGKLEKIRLENMRKISK